ncbi:hypothetical protein CsSME_00030810 [Camellia sinensis var. sinensis]
MELQQGRTEPLLKWQPVHQPKGREVVGVKWTYKTKLNQDGSRLKEVYFFETFSPTARMKAMRTLIALAAARKKLKFFQLEAASRILGSLWPKTSSRAYYSEIDSYFTKREFERSKSKPTLYVMRRDVFILIVYGYMDDLILIDNDIKMMQVFKKDMNCKAVSAPLAENDKITATRPDILFTASLLSRFMQYPNQIHFGAAKIILRYLQDTLDYGIMYKAVKDSKLIGYSDSDWAGSICSWASKKQKIVSQSSAEAEYSSS